MTHSQRPLQADHVLFTLILIVCVLFVANSASAAIRARRRELGVLACLGWTRPRLFTAVLGLHTSRRRAALAVPIAVSVAVIAGLIPAGLAARADPVASVRPPVLASAGPANPAASPPWLW